MNDYAARDALAVKLNGREYCSELTPTEEREAKAARLLIVFGASDDLTEFRGIIHDEAGAYQGTDHKIILDGGALEIANDDGECERCSERLQKMPGVIIKAEWAPEDAELSWRISTDVRHATFSIFEEGEPFCQGIVIDEADMLAALSPTPSCVMP